MYLVDTCLILPPICIREYENIDARRCVKTFNVHENYLIFPQTPTRMCVDM